MNTDLDAAAWSAIAARYLQNMKGKGADTMLDTAGQAASVFFDDLLPGEEHRVCGESVYCAFVKATELGFGIAVATLTLRPDEATPQIASLVQRTRVEVRGLIEQIEGPVPV